MTAWSFSPTGRRWPVVRSYNTAQTSYWPGAVSGGIGTACSSGASSPTIHSSMNRGLGQSIGATGRPSCWATSRGPSAPNPITCTADVYCTVVGRRSRQVVVTCQVSPARASKPAAFTSTNSATSPRRTYIGRPVSRASTFHGSHEAAGAKVTSPTTVAPTLRPTIAPSSTGRRRQVVGQSRADASKASMTGDAYRSQSTSMPKSAFHNPMNARLPTPTRAQKPASASRRCGHHPARPPTINSGSHGPARMSRLTISQKCQPDSSV